MIFTFNIQRSYSVDVYVVCSLGRFRINSRGQEKLLRNVIVGVYVDLKRFLISTLEFLFSLFFPNLFF